MSLIEVVIAVALLGMMSTAMMGAIFMTERSSQIQRHSALADAEMRRFTDWVQERDYTPCADPNGVVSARTNPLPLGAGAWSMVVGDPEAASTDTGLVVTGNGIPANTYVGTVVPGIGFLLSSSPTTQVHVNNTMPGTTQNITVHAKDYRGYTTSSTAFTAEFDAEMGDSGVRFADQALGDGNFTNGTDDFAGDITYSDRDETSCATDVDPGAQELFLKVTYTEGGFTFERTASVVKRHLN